MTNEFTAVIEQDGRWFIAYSPEMPGANGQGKDKDEALESLAQAPLSFLKTGVRTVSAAFRRMRSAIQSPSSEETRMQ